MLDHKEPKLTKQNGFPVFKGLSSFFFPPAKTYTSDYFSFFSNINFKELLPAYMTSETFEMKDSFLGFSDHILGAQTLPTSRTFGPKLPEKQ